MSMKLLNLKRGDKFKLSNRLYVLLDIDSDRNLLCMMIDKEYTDNRWVTSLQMSFNRSMDSIEYSDSDIKSDMDSIRDDIFKDSADYLNNMSLGVLANNGDKSSDIEESVRIITVDEFRKYRHILVPLGLGSYWTMTPYSLDTSRSCKVMYIKNDYNIDCIDCNALLYAYPIFSLNSGIEVDDTFENISNPQDDTEDDGTTDTPDIPDTPEEPEDPDVPDTPEDPDDGSTDEDVNERMWIGYLPYDETGTVGISSIEEIGANLTKDIIKRGVISNTVVEMDPQTLDKTSVGIVPTSAYVLCVFPKSKNYTVTIDNGIGEKEEFSDRHGEYSVNSLLLEESIDGVEYCVSGFLCNVESERFLYVD